MVQPTEVEASVKSYYARVTQREKDLAKQAAKMRLQSETQYHRWLAYEDYARLGILTPEERAARDGATSGADVVPDERPASAPADVGGV